MALPEPKQDFPIHPDTDGVLRVGKTRVTLDVLVRAFQEGATAEEIAFRYPTLDLTDIYSTITYYLQNRDEVEAYLAERDVLADRMRQKNEARWQPEGMRARLLARKSAPAHNRTTDTDQR